MAQEPHKNNSGLVRDIIIGLSEIAAGCISMGLGGQGSLGRLYDEARTEYGEAAKKQGRKKCDDHCTILFGGWVYPAVSLYPFER